MLSREEINTLLSLSRDAGNAIMKVYNSPDFGVETKDDHSPLTLADKASNDVIVSGLQSQFPSTPILSEEGKEMPYKTRSKWKEFWLVDPLDGTKEFIKKNDEFTVNIALIKEGYPVFGVVYLPANDILYYGGWEYGAFKLSKGELVNITVGNRLSERIAMRSRSHASEEEQEVYDKYGVTEFRVAGSSLKFCYVAEGQADLYYRHGPTMEWDTGAGQSIVEGAGGVVLNELGPDRFGYNKPNLLNNPFLVLGFDQ